MFPFADWCVFSSLKLILTKYFTKCSQTLLDGLGGGATQGGLAPRGGRAGLEVWRQDCLEVGLGVESGILCGAVAGGSEVVLQLCLELV